MHRKIALVSGGFDPLHHGHIKCFQAAAAIADGNLIVGLNSDDWLARKKGRAFMPYRDRYSIISNLRMVEFATDFNDDDGSANDFIAQILRLETDSHLIFCNGGDRGKTNTPEYIRWQHEPRVSFNFFVGGGEKANASSSLLETWVEFKMAQQESSPERQMQ